MIDSGQLCHDWLESKQTRVKASSYHKYERIMNMYVRDFLLEYSLETLTAESIQEYIQRMLDKGLSGSHIATVRYIIKDLYNYAEKRYGLKHLDFSSISVSHKTAKKEVLDEAEEKRLYDYCISHIHFSYLSVLLALCQGLRISEICGLKYKDVDLENGILNIHRVVLRNYKNESEASKEIEELEKWPARRQIVLADFLIDYLKKYMTSNDEEDFLISNSQKVPSDRNLQKHLDIINEATGIRAKFNMLRNTYRENCLNNGMNVWIVMETLGTNNLDLSLSRRGKSSIQDISRELKKVYIGQC